MLESKKLIGLNGWLGWIQILLMAKIALTATINLRLVIAPLLIFETSSADFLLRQVVFDFVQIAIAIICLVLFYKKKILFRNWFFIFSVITVAFIITNYIINEAPKLSWLLVPIIVGIYVLINIALHKSKRVKNTFS